jgi:hypothetical protein
MAFTTTDALLLQFQTQVDACAAWTGSTSDIHYPEISFATATFPCAVLCEDQRSSTYYAAGASGLRAGTLKATIYTQSAVGVTELLGREVLEQLLAQQTGIPFRGGYVGLCGEATDATTAAATPISAVELYLEYGLNP